LEQAGFTDVTEKINVEDREFGIKFKSVVDGVISGISMQVPDEIAELRITMWDADQQIVLSSDIVKSHRSPTFPAYTKIQGMAHYQVTAGKEYMLTINGNDWYEYKGTSEATYPIQVDNILITGFGYAVGTDLTFPNEFPTSYFAGNVDIVFKAN